MKLDLDDKVRLKLVTEDGSLLMDRKSNASWFFDYEWSKEPNPFLKVVLEDDARRKGVRILRIEHKSPLEFVAVVRWAFREKLNEHAILPNSTAMSVV